MNFIIPMAGRGVRFLQAGYEIPKMLLQAHGKTLLQWSVSSLPLDLAQVVIFVGLRQHEDMFQLEREIKKIYPSLNCKFIFLDTVTNGQAETVYNALKYCNENSPLVIFNIDWVYR